MNIFYKSFSIPFWFICAIGLAPFSHAEDILQLKVDNEAIKAVLCKTKPYAVFCSH